LKIFADNGYYMKIRIILTFLTIGLWIACSIGCLQQYSSAITSNELGVASEKISIAGYWVSENYFNSLKEYKSPKRAQDSSLLIIIPERIDEKAIILYDFHDGFDCYSIVKNRGFYEIWENFNSQNSKLEYIIKVISSNRIEIDATVLIKINPMRVKDFLHNGIKNEVLIQEELLFKGVYLTADGKRVEFMNNGQLEGLEGYYHYKPENDYYDQGMQVDQLILVKTETSFQFKDHEYYGFIFNYDTLELYKLHCVLFDSTSQNCAEVENGELRYKLWRIE
jgi:hypothetical protein